MPAAFRPGSPPAACRGKLRRATHARTKAVTKVAKIHHTDNRNRLFFPSAESSAARRGDRTPLRTLSAPDVPAPRENDCAPRGNDCAHEGTTAPARERLHPRGNDCTRKGTAAPTRERLCPRENGCAHERYDCAREGTTAPREGYEKAHSAPVRERNAKRMIIFRGAPYPECALPGMRPKRRGR